MNHPWKNLLIAWCFGLFGVISPAHSQDLSGGFYEIGTPSTVDVWVDPANGNDSASGSSRADALRTVDAAWRRIPSSTLLPTGYRLRLAAGEYTIGALPNYWESRWGTYQAPIILEAADGPGTAVFRSGPNVFDCRYLYFVDLAMIPNPPGDAFHCERCDHVLLRGNRISGGTAREAQETVKVNQSQYFYLERNDISGAHDNAVDFVAVQYGHVMGNRIHDAEDWCIYSKGGSSQIRVEGNEIFDCGTGGYTAGQGTGFEYMESPWLHYEAEDIKVVNNIIHDTQGAGLGVNGGYNILLAFNTMYRVGQRSHGIEVVFGARSCDGMTAQCAARVGAGGWGPGRTDVSVPIPNRNIYIFNNVLLNPSGYQSQWQHFAIYGPENPPAGSNVPSPARTDTNLRIRGNVIWNGPADLPLGIGESTGCLPENPSCNASQLIADNRINSLQPDFENAAAGNFHPGVVLGAVAGQLVPDFSGGDEPLQPHAPQGNLLNQVPRDFFGTPRDPAAPRIGALLAGSQPGAGFPSLPPPAGGSPGPSPVPTPANPGGGAPETPDGTLGPQFLGMTVSKTIFSSSGGRAKVTVYTAQTSRVTIAVQSLATGRIRSYRATGLRAGPDGVRRYTVSLPIPSNRTRVDQQYEIIARLFNRYGDRAEDYGAVTVRGRTRGRR